MLIIVYYNFFGVEDVFTISPKFQVSKGSNPCHLHPLHVYAHVVYHTQVYYRLGYRQVCAATIQEPQITSKYSKLRAKCSRCKEAAEGSNMEDEMKISIDKECNSKVKFSGRNLALKDLQWMILVVHVRGHTNEVHMCTYTNFGLSSSLSAYSSHEMSWIFCLHKTGCYRYCDILQVCR